MSKEERFFMVLVTAVRKHFYKKKKENQIYGLVGFCNLYLISLRNKQWFVPNFNLKLSQFEQF